MAGTAISEGQIRERVAALMPALTRDLAQLVAIPSVSAPGFPASTHEPLLEAYEAVAALFRDAGVQDVRAIELPDTAPVVAGEIPAPPGAPTVLLYSHYDVVAAGDEALWDSPPFTASERDGALYGRGTADTKANILVHVGALRAWDGRPPVGVKILIEGQEEVGSPLETDYPREHREALRADAMLIADSGSIRPGDPALSVSLRGDAALVIEAHTLASDKHSGQYGGAAPDALLALLRALASLHDADGNVAVEGLEREPWRGLSYEFDEFRALAEILPDLPLLGTGTLGERIWSGPAVTVTGIDAPAVDGAVAAVQAYARARLNIRVHPRQPAAEAQAAVIRHLEAQQPYGVAIEVLAGDTGDGFWGATSGPAWTAMEAAMTAAWGKAPVEMATGGAIPLVKALSDAVPEATMLLFGACDSFANIHGPNERVLLSEFENAVLAEALFLGGFAAAQEGQA